MERYQDWKKQAGKTVNGESWNVSATPMNEVQFTIDDSRLTKKLETDQLKYLW